MNRLDIFPKKELKIDPKLQAMIDVAFKQYKSKECNLSGAITRAINQSGDFSPQEKKRNFWYLHGLIKRNLEKKLRNEELGKKSRSVSRAQMIRQAQRKKLLDEKRAGDTYEEAGII